jgi:hypothetical protein
MTFQLFNMATNHRSPKPDFDTLMFEPVARWRERAPSGAPQRALEKRLVAN